MFKALHLTQRDGKTEALLRDFDDADLPPGDVTVRVAYSSLNYKDALAVTGRGPVIRRWPLVPGIDLVGTVERSDDARWKAGDAVVVNGWGLGETEWGGFAQKARLSGDWLLALPPQIAPWDAAAFGTAGYTAALCVMALQRHGLAPSDGPVLVTGASGGVGSIAVSLLAGLGYTVTASSGANAAQAETLRSLGAAEVIDRAELGAPGKPLQRERWAGAIDTAGSHTLANVCATLRWNGAVAACGLAQGSDFPATVMPFILRGVTLYGINCVFVPNDTRRRAYELLGQYVPLDRLRAISTEVGLTEVVAASHDLLDGRRKGRAVVAVDR
ncbi:MULTISPECIES: MDR family oxidoreductase [Ramlibacter]|uniref:Acryloyl-CoA reductase n=1 Tax=Ramlibacter pinisoli TaxID=2682844 RepID=A0A6N8IZW0_9BURK|nr:MULTISPECIES: MDR family oxidoreductase [Ramlibacter]MBA2962376.1 oxidoreductase [Ramlibacter sp. CGMCC 1.13660]MVQ32318.1 acryloyl-CoA reductase [Ramlibacter pinisoli]